MPGVRRVRRSTAPTGCAFSRRHLYPWCPTPRRPPVPAARLAHRATDRHYRRRRTLPGGSPPARTASAPSSMASSVPEAEVSQALAQSAKHRHLAHLFAHAQFLGAQPGGELDFPGRATANNARSVNPAARTHSAPAQHCPDARRWHGPSGPSRHGRRARVPASPMQNLRASWSLFAALRQQTER